MNFQEKVRTHLVFLGVASRTVRIAGADPHASPWWQVHQSAAVERHFAVSAVDDVSVLTGFLDEVGVLPHALFLPSTSLSLMMLDPPPRLRCPR